VIRKSLPVVLLLVEFLTSASNLLAEEPSRPPKAPPTATEGSYANVNGQRLYYRISGSGPNLLLLHGGLSSSEDFDKVLPSLEKSFRVLRVDRGGHGRSSDSGEPFVYSAMAEEMKAFLDVVGVSSTAILGWSDGGVVGYHLASRYPRLVTSLVAIGANTRVDGMAAETVAWIRSKSTPESLLGDLPQVVASYRRLSPTPDRLPSFLMRSRDLWLRDPYIAADDLKKIEAPVLLLAGDTHDIRIEHLLEIRAALRRARLCILPGASHFMLQEKPDLLLPIVLDFLNPEKDAKGAAGAASSAARSVTLPFTLDHNRMIVDVDFVRGDGTLRTARAWVDTGNPTLVLGDALARDLGLEVVPPVSGSAQSGSNRASRTPGLLVGGMALDATGVRTKVQAGARTMPGVPAEANLPSSVLRSLHVVFDYPKRQLTLAQPGVARPRGVALQCRVNDETGLVQIDAMIDDVAHALGVDIGSSYTWVSNAVTASWESRHADRPRARGAVGAANFFGFPFERAGRFPLLATAARPSSVRECAPFAARPFPGPRGT
jgi:pimeloyl-ACP methyl ester carboxylesterase